MEKDNLFRVHTIVQRTPSQGELTELKQLRDKHDKKEEATKKRMKEQGRQYNPHGHTTNFNNNWDAISLAERNQLDSRLKNLMAE